MVRIKVPYGGITADQLDLLASVAERYSRGWGHLTTRLNVQIHFVQLERVPDLLRELAAVTETGTAGDVIWARQAIDALLELKQAADAAAAAGQDAIDTEVLEKIASLLQAT